MTPPLSAALSSYPPHESLLLLAAGIQACGDSDSSVTWCPRGGLPHPSSRCQGKGVRSGSTQPVLAAVPASVDDR
jgi:hypothetical protein